MGPTTVRVIGVKFMKEKISHYQVVKMVLVRVMALVEHNHVYFFHFCKSVHKEVVKLLGHCYKYIVGVKFFSPCIKFRVVFAVAFLSTQISTYLQTGVPFNCCGLLFNQILNWHDEENFLSSILNRALMTGTVVALISGS